MTDMRSNNDFVENFFSQLSHQLARVLKINLRNARMSSNDMKV